MRPCCALRCVLCLDLSPSPKKPHKHTHQACMLAHAGLLHQRPHSSCPLSLLATLSDDTTTLTRPTAKTKTHAQLLVLNNCCRPPIATHPLLFYKTPGLLPGPTPPAHSLLAALSDGTTQLGVEGALRLLVMLVRDRTTGALYCLLCIKSVTRM